MNRRAFFGALVAAPLVALEGKRVLVSEEVRAGSLGVKRTYDVGAYGVASFDTETMNWSETVWVDAGETFVEKPLSKISTKWLTGGDRPT